MSNVNRQIKVQSQIIESFSKEELILHEQLALKRLRRIHQRELWRKAKHLAAQAWTLLFRRPEAAEYLARKDELLIRKK